MSVKTLWLSLQIIKKEYQLVTVISTSIPHLLIAVIGTSIPHLLVAVIGISPPYLSNSSPVLIATSGKHVCVCFPYDILVSGFCYHVLCKIWMWKSIGVRDGNMMLAYFLGGMQHIAAIILGIMGMQKH